VLFDDEVERLARMWCKPHPQVELLLDLRCASLWGHIESQWLKIALEKVVRNALRAMNGDGRLMVSTRRAGDYLRLLVHDNGVGLPDYARRDFLKRPIPRPMESNGEEHRGTGKGVLIARFVLLMHGGNLELDFSSQEQGTQVSIQLPIYDSPAARRALEEYAT
jgi:two-component system sensor histidine kinase VicK